MNFKQTISQLFLLFKKNWIIQKRKPIITLIEIFVPVLLSVIVLLLRAKVKNVYKENPHVWREFSIDSFPDYNYYSKWTTFLPCIIAFTPNTTWSNSIMLTLQSSLKIPKLPNNTLKLKPFDMESKMDTAIIETFNNETSWKPLLYKYKYEKFQIKPVCSYLGGIVFNGDDEKNVSKIPKNLKVTIKLSSTPRNSKLVHYLNPFKDNSNWQTQFTVPIFQMIGPREVNNSDGGSPGYWKEGFLSLQRHLTFAIMKFSCGNSTECLNKLSELKKLNLFLRRLPYPPYEDDHFILVIQKYLPLVIMMSFVFIALNIVKDIVHEKEVRLKEAMKIMGLNGWMHWTAWFAKYFIFAFISTGFMTLMLSVNGSDKGSVIGYTDKSVLFVFLFVYSLSTICFAFAISVLFSKANPGAAGAGIIFVVSYIPYFYIQQVYNSLSMAAKISICLIPNLAMALGGQVIGMFEGTASGVQWNNFNNGVSVDDDFSLMHATGMMLIDCVICLIITWYIEAVFPGQYGVALPFYFPFTKSYWYKSQPILNEITEQDFVAETFFEPEPNLPIGIQIKNLRKVYGKGKNKKVAVEGLTLNILEGQILALLGQNGAGKTTTMSMLTGFIRPTSGTAFVNGYDIVSQMSLVRQSLGFCPQHNILFESLTVEEHLDFFARLKGCHKSELVNEIDRYLDSMNLNDKRHCLSRTLSGGQKRKLSIAIALIAQSRIVILDEPTAGMDATARRQLWDILQNSRLNRTIIMSTHMMDEADILGDRIAILSEGVLQCCGSSVFLKGRYGAGYHLGVLRKENVDTDDIFKIVRKHVPIARLDSDVAGELSFLLPREFSQTFQHLFRELELASGDLGITGLGVSVTTMEEVFFRVRECTETERQLKYARLDDLNASKDSDVDSGAPSLASAASTANITLASTSNNSSTMITGRRNCHLRNRNWKLLRQQFYGMLVKKILYTHRNYLVTSTQLLLPIFFTICGLIVVRNIPSLSYSPPLTLDLSHYEKNLMPFSTPQLAISRNILRSVVNVHDRNMDVDNIAKNITNGNANNLFEYLIKEGRDNLAYYISKYSFAIEATTRTSKSSNDSNIIGYFNDQAYHTPAVMLSILSSGFLNYVEGDIESLAFINKPLPRSAEQKLKDEESLQFTGFIIGFEIVFGMSFLSAGFALFLIRERSSGAKHVQLVSGVHKATFWIASFVWDYITYLIPCCCLFIVFAAFNVKDYTDNFQYMLLLFIVYGLAMLPCMYVWSFLFDIPSTGYVWLTLLNIISGEVTILIVDIMSIPQFQLVALANSLKWAFYVFFPNFNLGQGLQQIYLNYETANVCRVMLKKVPKMILCDEKPDLPCCPKCSYSCVRENYLDWNENGIGKQLVFLLLQCFFYVLLLTCIESGIWLRLKPFLYDRRRKEIVNVFRSEATSISSIAEDDDVTNERGNVENANPMDYGLILKNICKSYGDLVAVDKINIAVRHGETFGLLGVNGAGKTSIFKMITGDQSITSGSATLAGYSVLKEMRDVRQEIGYCPQFDALIDQMTGREMLTMIGRLRGVMEDILMRVVNELIDAVSLKSYADRACGKYSGGNKRKLSTAMALIGDPSIILLDEPTAGMDPVARRSLWNVLNKIRTSGRTLILTSHSMDECEAICSRLAIMINGQFRCLGTTQHLKCKFGQGYTVVIKLSAPTNESQSSIQRVLDFIDTTWPGSKMVDMHENMVHYHVSSKSAKISDLFGKIEDERVNLRIDDYVVSQTTLEQVFLNLTKYQRSAVNDDDLDHKENGCSSCFSWCNCFVCCRRTRGNRGDSGLVTDDLVFEEDLDDDDGRSLI